MENPENYRKKYFEFVENPYREFPKIIEKNIFYFIVNSQKL